MNALYSIPTPLPSCKDVIHDIAFDHYGRRMATCSSDMLVKVWNKENDKGEWKKSAEWKAHNDSVWKISWVHPEFGVALATCSLDRTVIVWEEQAEGSVTGGWEWALCAKLTDTKSSVLDIEFAPKNLGLLLAICSSGGSIKIYKAPDVLNLSCWILQKEVNCKHEACCISWNPNLKIESDLPRFVKLSDCNKTEANGSNNIYSKLPFIIEETNSFIVVPQEPILAVGLNGECEANDRIVILQFSSRLNQWNIIEHITTGKDQNTSNIDSICDVAFAPRLGRNYDLLAVAAQDIKVFAYYVITNPSSSSFKNKLHLLSSFDGHNNFVWRVNWNSLGNVLITSGDDNCIKFWEQHELLSDKPLKTDKKSKPAINSATQIHKQFHWKNVKIIKA